ncbi:acyl-CoA reductase [Pokkaliibacter sp. CJK22405]|uniref:acyl-CoA reductase n=1 Tax=Pokkaliibacter sp. CJK22405 TaxID=3384615 RepID=UPI003985334B
MNWLFPSQAGAVTPQRSLDNTVEALLAELSSLCMASPSASLKALGFWLRPAHLKQMKTLVAGQRLRPRGHVLQVAPGNVDTLFIYVSLLALWMGNVVTVRLSSRESEDERLLLTMLNTLNQHTQWQSALARLRLLRCDYDDPQWLRQLACADVRVFWGSNQTLAQLSQLPKAAHCTELLMGHKHSLCLIHSAELLADQEMRWAEGFIRDTLEFAQQGCASPRTLIWLGNDEDNRQAQARFWSVIAEKSAKDSAAASRYPIDEAGALERLLQLQSLTMDGLISAPWQQSGAFVRLPVSGLNQAQEARHPAQGVIFEWQIEQLASLATELRPWHQTLTFIGGSREALVDWALSEAVPGLDRIEPVGQALVFDPVWDGHSLLLSLARLLR